MRLWLLYTMSLISIVVSAAGLFPFSPLSVNPALYLLHSLTIPNTHLKLGLNPLLCDYINKHDYILHFYPQFFCGVFPYTN